MLRINVGVSGAARLTAILGLSLCLVGCGSSKSADEALKRGLAQSGTTQLKVVKFAGTVTVDGQPPGVKLYGGHRLLVMLYDPKDPPSAKHKILYVDCLPEPNDGAFEFSTYSKGDGVPPGHYIVLFADYPVGFTSGPHGADRLKNRFNDPDKNEKNPKFVVDVTEPGRTDWEFNLSTDADPPAAPGPKAVLNPAQKK